MEKQRDGPASSCPSGIARMDDRGSEFVAE
jgi:hypothetical protein